MNANLLATLALMALLVAAPAASAQTSDDGGSAPLSDCVDWNSSTPLVPPTVSVAGCRDFIADLIDPDL